MPKSSAKNSPLELCKREFERIKRPTDATVRRVAKKVGCTLVTAIQALSAVREERALKEIQSSRVRPTRARKPTRLAERKPPANPLSDLKVGDSVPLLLRHLGVKRVLSLDEFCKTLSFPAYYGLMAWQKRVHDVVLRNKATSILVARGHGKSVYLSNFEQWAMTFAGYDILHLGWTARRKEVAENVYGFNVHWDLVKTTKSTSPFHFSTILGGRYDNFLITSKETLGLHGKGDQSRGAMLQDGDLEVFTEEAATRIREHYESNVTQRKLVIVIDDPIDDSFRDERHKEDTLERRFKSTILNIHPHKWIFAGTRKFEGDFFDFLEDVFDQELAVFKYGPFVEDPDDPLYANKDHLLCPELFTVEDLATIRAQNGEYWWHAEYCQNPHPILGEVWQGVTYVGSQDEFVEYDIVGLALDRATTVKARSDLTGFVKFARHVNSGQILVLDDLSDKYDFETTNELLDREYRSLRLHFPRSRVIIVVEKQGGGEDLVASARARGFTWTGHVVLLHSTRDKVTRIVDYLEHPINSGHVVFLNSLRKSELIKEIETFPHPRYFDAIDALAMGVAELEKHPVKRTESGSVVHKLRRIGQDRHYQAYRHPWERGGSGGSVFGR